MAYEEGAWIQLSPRYKLATETSIPAGLLLPIKSGYD